MFHLLGEARTGQGRDWARDGPEKATAWLKASSCTVVPWQASVIERKPMKACESM